VSEEKSDFPCSKVSVLDLFPIMSDNFLEAAGTIRSSLLELLDSEQAQSIFGIIIIIC
jgi:hypothetical protein